MEGNQLFSVNQFSYLKANSPGCYFSALLSPFRPYKLLSIDGPRWSATIVRKEDRNARFLFRLYELFVCLVGREGRGPATTLRSSNFVVSASDRFAANQNQFFFFYRPCGPSRKSLNLFWLTVVRVSQETVDGPSGVQGAHLREEGNVHACEQ